MYLNGYFQNVNTLEVGAGREKMDKAIAYGAVRFSVFKDFCFFAVKD